MDLAEKIAKSVVEELIPRARMRFREQQHDGSHDFDLILPDNTTAALEVTASKDFELEKTKAAIRRDKNGGYFIPTVKCQNDWSIDPLPDAHINRVRAEADDYLARIEADGLDQFFYDTDGGRYDSVRRICEDLSIEAGSVTQWKNPGQICISSPGGGGCKSHKVAERAVMSEADKNDNRTKLAMRVRSNACLFSIFIRDLRRADRERQQDLASPVVDREPNPKQAKTDCGDDEEVHARDDVLVIP